MKTCKKCSTEKFESEFYGNPKAADRLDSACKPCRLQVSRKYYVSNVEKFKARRKEYREKNRAAVREREKRYQQENREACLEKLRGWQRKNPDRHWEWVLRTEFGLSAANYYEMFAAQNGVCAACKRPEEALKSGKIKRLAVDHCHTTGKIRGLLCGGCNRALGMLRESFDATLGLARYIQEHKGVV